MMQRSDVLVTPGGFRAACFTTSPRKVDGWPAVVRDPG